MKRVKASHNSGCGGTGTADSMIVDAKTFSFSSSFEEEVSGLMIGFNCTEGRWDGVGIEGHDFLGSGKDP
jgi:hypothetical protein